MSHRKVLKIGVCMIILSLLSGCWDATDVDKLAIVMIAGYDTPVSVADTNIHVSALTDATMGPGEVRGVDAHTIGASRTDRNYSTPRAYALTQLQLALYGEELARQGLKNYVDILLREPAIKHSIHLAITEGKAVDFLHAINKNEPKLGGQSLINLVQLAPDQSYIPVCTLYDFALNMNTKGENPVIPVLSLIHDGKVPELSGIAIFNKDTMIDKVGQLESRWLMMLRGLQAKAYVPFTVYRNGEVFDRGSVLLSNDRDVKVVRNGNEFDFYITIFLEGTLAERYNQQPGFFDKNRYIKEIEEAIASDTKEGAEQFIRYMQKDLQIDCIDISKYALAKWRKELQDQVDHNFINERVNIHVDVKVTIKNVGELG
jgi:Ger(x)C family germination protein